MTKLVYLSYPEEGLHATPLWVKDLLDTASEEVVFHVSGMTPSLSVSKLLEARMEGSKVNEMVVRLAQGTTRRLIDSLVSMDLSKILYMQESQPQSVEFHVLRDLWILSRSDVYVVDTDILGRAKCGVEVSAIHGIIPTLGVSDSFILDPWFIYYLDGFVKSTMVSSKLRDLL